ncbi:MAG TPA: hypothetical protein VGI14_20995 [Casimicrobiaceae bacterium]
MQWRKLGLVWAPSGDLAWARTHAMLPTPMRLNDDVVRVFVTCLDDAGRGRPAYVDVSARDPTRVVDAAREPLLDVGERGTFDDNGVAALCAVPAGGRRVHLYYAGFELCTQVRYRIFTGLALSDDGGGTFRRHARVPVLDRSDDERYFRCGAFVMRDGGLFRMWYIAGSRWTTVEGRELPVYTLRYLESADGVQWGATGTPSMDVSEADEHGFGRPWVIRRAEDDYRMFYSIRSRSRAAYGLGYAESDDGLTWRREDDAVGLVPTPGAFDAHALMYMSLIEVDGRTYCFYNGDDFGRQGFGAAELVS